jgi:hypothetical protein
LPTGVFGGDFYVVGVYAAVFDRLLKAVFARLYYKAFFGVFARKFFAQSRSRAESQTGSNENSTIHVVNQLSLK